MTDWRDTPLKDNKPVDVDRALSDIIKEVYRENKDIVTAIKEIKELFKENK